MKEVTVHYYAALREKRGLSKEVLRTKMENAWDLFQEIDKKYHFFLTKDIVKVAINDEFVGWESNIRNGDAIIFIPPVAGG